MHSWDFRRTFSADIRAVADSSIRASHASSIGPLSQCYYVHDIARRQARVEVDIVWGVILFDKRGTSTLASVCHGRTDRCNPYTVWYACAADGSPRVPMFHVEGFDGECVGCIYSRAVQQRGIEMCYIACMQ